MKQWQQWQQWQQQQQQANPQGQPVYLNHYDSNQVGPPLDQGHYPQNGTTPVPSQPYSNQFHHHIHQSYPQMQNDAQQTLHSGSYQPDNASYQNNLPPPPMGQQWSTSIPPMVPIMSNNVTRPIISTQAPYVARTLQSQIPQQQLQNPQVGPTTETSQSPPQVLHQQSIHSQASDTAGTESEPLVSSSHSKNAELRLTPQTITTSETTLTKPSLQHVVPTTSSLSKASQKPSIQKPKLKSPKTDLNSVKIQEQALYDLGNQFYSHAVSQRSNITTRKHVQEYYTLIKLSITTLRKLLNMRNKASLTLRIKANILIARILTNETDQMSLTDAPETFLSDAVQLCGDSMENRKLRYEAEVGILQDLHARGRYKQALKYLATCSFADTFLFRYLKFSMLKETEPLKAHQVLLQVLSSSEFESLEKDTKDFLMLMEIAHCLEVGVKSNSILDSLRPSLPQLDLLWNFLVVFREIQTTQSIKSPSTILDAHLKAINNIISSGLTTPDIIHFPFESYTIDFSVSLPSGPAMNSIFFVIFSVAKMNTTYIKHKPLSTLQMAEKQLQSALDVSSARSVIKSNNTENRAMETLKTVIGFYTLIEASVASDPFSESGINQRKHGKSMIQDPILLRYANALDLHLTGSAEAATKDYLELAAEMEQRYENRYNDLYICVCLNLQGLVESQVEYASRLQYSDKMHQLMNLRNVVAQKLANVYEAPNSSLYERYLFETTTRLLHLLFNPTNLTIFEITKDVDSILINQEQLKNYPLLLSMLLYVKSSALNQNSDQKQKSSQSAFNLAKLGYSPLVRYTTGLLNAECASRAQNAQQLEIQQQKLAKIEQTITPQFTKLI